MRDGTGLTVPGPAVGCQGRQADEALEVRPVAPQALPSQKLSLLTVPQKH